MSGWRFCLYKRKSGIFYAELLNPEGVRVLFRSTKVKDRDQAVLSVSPGSSGNHFLEIKN